MRHCMVLCALLCLGAGGWLLAGCAPKTQANANARTLAAPNSAAESPSTNGRSGGGAEFRAAHQETFALLRTVGNIGRMEHEGRTPLTPAQATSLLAVLTPLRTKTSLTQDEAKAVSEQITPILTAEQLAEIEKMPAPRAGGGQGNGGGNGGGMRAGAGGQGGAGGQRPRMDTEAMKDFNPFNPPAGSPMAERGAARWQRFFDNLTKKANGEAITPGDASAPADAPAAGHHHGGGQQGDGDAPPPAPGE